MTCFECDEPALHRHHVVPRSLGGIRTVPLCERCHGLVHDRGMVGHARLTKQALQSKKANSELIGAVPYGMQRLTPTSRWIVPNEQEQEVIRVIRALRELGASLRGVSNALAARGMLARNGKPFAPQQIARLCSDVTPIPPKV